MIRFDVIVAPDEIEQISNNIISYFNTNKVQIDKWNRHNPEQLEIVRIRTNEFFIIIIAYFNDITTTPIVKSGRINGYVISRSLKNILTADEMVIINAMDNIRWHDFKGDSN